MNIPWREDEGEEWASWQQMRDWLLDHLEGRLFCPQFEAGEFGLLPRKFADSPCRAGVVALLRQGAENLGVLVWAVNLGHDLEDVARLLETIDLAGRRDWLAPETAAERAARLETARRVRILAHLEGVAACAQLDRADFGAVPASLPASPHRDEVVARWKRDEALAATLAWAQGRGIPTGEVLAIRRALDDLTRRCHDRLTG